MPEFFNIEVCEDCYIAHHYGMNAEGISADANPWALYPDAKLGDITDNTDPESETDSGITSFSWNRCEGCGSALGGSRYRMAIWS